MYDYIWDKETGGLLLTTNVPKFSKEPRPVYYKELDILGFDKFWNYPKDDHAPLMWAELNNYIYKGKAVAKTVGGSIYTKPDIEILEEPEADGMPLQFVDIEAMCEKNKDMLETLVQETIKNIYSTYIDYRNKVDVFYVAFSGGKDSVVTLDLVQRALPHNVFIAVFGNTDMEFPTTLKLVKGIKKYCKKNSIKFYEANAEMSSNDSWKLFGPPARRVRWCCTIHKSAPVVNLLKKKLGLNKFRSMMITGVRADESASRSEYDELSFGKKIAGQYSFHPILRWSSAEVFLYMFLENLTFNEAYKFGLNRVGCIMCPNSSDKHEYIKRQMFKKRVDEYCSLIVSTSNKDLSDGRAKTFIETGGWKTRFSGRELINSDNNRVVFENRKESYAFKIAKHNNDWEIWYKTVGDIIVYKNCAKLEYNGFWRTCSFKRSSDSIEFVFNNEKTNKNCIEFISLFKSVLIKSQYCIHCGVCLAECPMGCIHMENGLSISDSCIQCHSCLKVESGCLYYNSIRGVVNMSSVKGINRYLSVGVDYGWIRQYFIDQSYEPGNRKTDVMFSYLTDAGILSKKSFTKFGKIAIRLDVNSVTTNSLMLCNLAYCAPFKWYFENIPLNKDYTEDDLKLDLSMATPKAIGEYWNGLKVIIGTNPIYQLIGCGSPNIDEKKLKNGQTQKKMKSIVRKSWESPIPEVILYSLFKFAEACEGYYQFSLSELMDDEIEREGISPTRIFGLDRSTMIALLNGLSTHYPEFIRASFTLDLETITLSSDRSAEDVLDLF